MSDEDKLSGFLDGELDSVQNVQFEAALAADPALQHRLDEMRRMNALVRDAGGSFAGEEVPPRILETINARLAHAEVGRETTARQADNDNWQSRWRLGGAIAASLAIGSLFGTQLERPAGETLISPALASNLETVPSGQSIMLGTGTRMTPQFTFASVDGGFCRQFILEAAKAGGRTGLACRTDGRWNVQALIPTATASSAGEGYVVAEGPPNASLEAEINLLRKGDPLGAATEAELIKNHWRDRSDS